MATILVNCMPEERGMLKTLEWLLGNAGHTGVVVTKTLTATQAISIARTANCSAILLSNSNTLAQLVPSEKPSLSDWRGSRINLTVPVIVMAPLDHVFSKAEGRWLLEKDIAKLALARMPVEPFKYTLLNNPNLFPEWLEKAANAVVIGEDIETDQHGMARKKGSSKRVPCFHPGTLDVAGLGETWITCVAFSLLMPNGDIDTCVLPLVNGGGEDYWLDDSNYAKAIGFLRDMNAQPAAKCFHNGLYDCFHLIRYRAWPKNWTLDTMGLSHSWYSELPKTLSFLASWLLYDAYYWKDLADSTHKSKDMESYWLYNAKDTWMMMRCLRELMLRGDSWMFTNYAKAFRQCYPSLYGAFEGWLVDLDKRDELALDAADRLQNARNRLRLIADDANFNPGSSQQVSHLIHDIMGAKKNPRAKSASATDKKSRTYIAAQHPILTRVVELVNDYAKDAKAISTYYSYLVYHSRLLFSLDPFGTDTGRAASRASAAWVGTQIQNQPPYAKPMYKCDPGYIGFELDYKKAEAVCTAHLAGCATLIELLYDESQDFYKRLGVLFFRMDYEAITKEFRNKVLKKIQHGTNYMMGALTFIDNLDDINVMYFAAQLLQLKISANPSKHSKNELTISQFAQRLLDSYHVPFPEVKLWWAAIKEEIRSTGKLVSPTGHVRVFFGDITKDHKVWRSGVAHQPQNLSVENLALGYWKAWKYACSYPVKEALRLKTQIHDSLNGQVLISEARHIIPELAKLVRAECMVKGRLMTIDVDIEVYHTNWAEKVAWKDFLNDTLPTLEKEKLQTSIIDGRQLALSQQC